jgi:hypothetical protein
MSSPLVSETMMEATWQRVAGATGAEAQRLQKATAKEQEELMDFVLAMSSELSEDALGLALYAHLVIAEAFRRSGGKFRKVTPAKILSAWESAKEMAAPLKEHGRSAAERLAESTSEPAVLDYILGALDEDEGDEPVYLTDDEFWHILCILKTVSDCLHGAKKIR